MTFNLKPKVSVIIPTCNRPGLLSRAIKSVLNQTYQDFEIIVVDDGDQISAEDTVRQFNFGEVRPPVIAQFGEVKPHSDISERIKYIKHAERKGGAAARNTGIKAARGEFIAFLDDDDEWLSEKLEIQMKKFENTSADVGFCFSAVRNIYDDHEEDSKVEDGINDYHKISLTRFKGFLTSSLIVKKDVFDECGAFDESLPSHQEAELILRITKKYKGLGIDQPLVKMTMISGHEHINSDIKRKIAGREQVLEKHLEELQKYPEILAKHYFWLALWYRQDKQYQKARGLFQKAFSLHHRILYFLHYVSLFFGGEIYELFVSKNDWES